MASYLSPGVYVEEYDNSPRAIEGVGTSTAGFIGLAEKGPSIGAPELITNYNDFLRLYGGPLSEFEYGEYRYLAPSVEQFFANGGGMCYVSRVVPADAKCASVQKGILTVTAKNEGKWGNKLQFTINTVMKKKMQIVGAKDDSYVAKSVSGFREGDLVCVGTEINRIKSILDNVVTFEEVFTANIVDTAMIPKTVVYLVEWDVQVRYNDIAEKYGDVCFNIASPNYIGFRMANSELVDIEIAPVQELVNPATLILDDGADSGMFMLEKGSDGSMSAVNAGTFIGEDNGPGKRTGIASFVENNIVSIMAVPGITIPEVQVAMVGHCENLKSRFAVLDMPKEMSKPKDLLEFRQIVDSTYCAMYHPWVKVFDRVAGKPGLIPPSGAVLGVYARTDTNRGVHKAPANEVIFATGLAVDYNKQEQDVLNPEGINLIRRLPGQGIRIWGARTASSNVSFKYVNVRRLFIYLEESIKANTNWVVFEPNDSDLWSRVQISITGFLNDMWRSGMIVGSTPQEAYFVEIGPSTMSKDDIANGRLICNIGIAPSRPAEFVIFRVTQHTAEAEASAE